MNGDLKIGEPHPSAHFAYHYIKSLGFTKQAIVMEALSSSAIDGNRSAEVCAETLRRVMVGEPVSDRYILGLAWYLRDLD
jgi:hypothetical protein